MTLFALLLLSCSFFKLPTMDIVDFSLYCTAHYIVLEANFARLGVQLVCFTYNNLFPFDE